MTTGHCSVPAVASYELSTSFLLTGTLEIKGAETLVVVFPNGEEKETSIDPTTGKFQMGIGEATFMEKVNVGQLSGPCIAKSPKIFLTIQHD